MLWLHYSSEILMNLLHDLPEYIKILSTQGGVMQSKLDTEQPKWLIISLKILANQTSQEDITIC